jgi:hypothetical protein
MVTSTLHSASGVGIGAFGDGARTGGRGVGGGGVGGSGVGGGGDGGTGVGGGGDGGTGVGGGGDVGRGTLPPSFWRKRLQNSSSSVATLSLLIESWAKAKDPK